MPQPLGRPLAWRAARRLGSTLSALPQHAVALLVTIASFARQQHASACILRQLPARGTR